MKKTLATLAILLAASFTSAEASDNRFMTAHGLKPLAQSQFETADQRVNRSIGHDEIVQFDAFGLGLAWVQMAEPELERARYRIQLFIDHQDPELLYLDILRVNMGPFVRADLARSYGPDNVEPDARDRHPHRRWRLQLNNFHRGQLHVARASVATISTSSQYRCFEVPCMAENKIEVSPRLTRGEWQEWHPARNAFTPIRKPRNNRLDISLLLTAGTLERAYLSDKAAWANEGEGDWRTRPVAEMVAELAPGNGDGDHAILCTMNMLDDSVRDSCLALHRTEGTEYYRQYIGCYRGRPNREGLCP